VCPGGGSADEGVGELRWHLCEALVHRRPRLTEQSRQKGISNTIANSGADPRGTGKGGGGSRAVGERKLNPEDQHHHRTSESGEGGAMTTGLERPQEYSSAKGGGRTKEAFT